MKAKEFILEDDVLLDEGWKDWVAGAALGAAALGGGQAALDAWKDKGPGMEKPAATAQAAQKQVQPATKAVAANKNAIPKTSVTGTQHEAMLVKMAAAAGITGTELAQFLGQVAHETGDFRHMVEVGGKLDFKKYDIQYNPKKAKILGNTKPGDGEKYRGRGYLQITGKYNYQKAGEALGVDLVNHPEMLERPAIAAKAAIWFWKNRVQPRVSDFDNTKEVTKPINPGLKHLDQRQEKFNDFKVAMG